MHLGILSQPSNFHCQKWAKALQNAGHTITVISLEPYTIPNVPCINLNKKDTWDYQDFYFTRKKLKEVLKTEKIEVLHPLHLTPYGVWGYWADFQPMIPAAMGADVFEYLPYHAIPELAYRHWKNLTFQPNFFSRLKNWATKSFHKSMVKKVLMHSQYITADNQTLIKALNEYFHVPLEKLVLQRWGIEEEIFHLIEESDYTYVLQKYGLDAEQPIILSPRGLMPVYQADIILNAFAKLVSEYKNYQWVMLSAGYSIPITLKSFIYSLEQKHKNFHCIKVQIPREEMAVLWKKTKVFISAPIYDGYSAAIAEGRYVGAIPVVNKIPGNEEVIQNEVNGIIVHPFTPSNLTKTLKKILDDIDTWYSQFLPINQDWIQKHGLIQHDAKQFSEFLEIKFSSFFTNL